MNAKQFISEKASKQITYYKCIYDAFGQRTGEIVSYQCSQLEFDCMKMAGENVYLDGLMAQRIALS